jgi:hypothetical protein
MMKDLRVKVSARIEQRLHTDLDRTTAVQDKLNGQLSQLAAAAGGATPQMQRAADLATNISRLQNRFAVLDEQVRNLTLQANAPGSAYFSSVASIPTHIAWMLVLKKPLMYGLGGIILALVAVLIANNMDQKIYVAADVTAVLGFAPMAQLPNFREVSPGIAEDHMLRLTAAIDHACRQGNLKNCIFTAVAAGAGTTTIATRVRSMLESMGRPTVLVDASGAPAQQSKGEGQGKGPSTALVSSERASRSTALMQQLTDEGEEVESLVLTDTAPLPISAETEYLARYVDAAIVVLESGVTTRAQLRAAADTLSRLDVAAVGFVLNKVGLKTADLPFRNTVRAMEQHQGTQNRVTARLKAQAAVASPELPAGRARASLDKGSARELAQGVSVPAVSTPVQSAVPPPGRGRAEGVPAAPVSAAQATREATPRTEADAGKKPGAPEQELPKRPMMSPNLEEAQASRARPTAPPRVGATMPQAGPVQAPQAASAPDNVSRRPEPPAPPVGLPRRPIQDPAPARLQEWEDFAASAASKPEAPRPVEKRSEPRREPGTDTQVSQLGSLRDASFAAALKNLTRPASDSAQRPIIVDLPPSNLEVERAPSTHARFDEPLIPGKGMAGSASRTSIPHPDRARTAPSTTLVTAQPEFLPPKSDAEAEGKAAKKGSTPTRQDRRDSADDVEILPSWRGQYKKR